MNCKYLPSQKTFVKEASVGQWRPLFLRLDAVPEPRVLYEKLRKSAAGPSFLFESARILHGTGRHSFILQSPFMRFCAHGDRQVLSGKKRRTRKFSGNPFTALRKTFSEFPAAGPVNPEIPFWGGAAGIFSYELKNQIERFGGRLRDPYHIPDIDMAFFDRGVVYDHDRKIAYAFMAVRCTAHPVSDYRAAQSELRCFAEALPKVSEQRIKEQPAGRLHFKPWVPQHAAAFQKKVLKVKSHIRRGDIFQANLSHCLSVDCPGDPFALYCAQADMNPTCFAAYADFGDYQIVCGSPERSRRSQCADARWP